MSTTQRLRGVFLTALLVMSVFAGSVAFAGAATAAASNAPTVTAAVEYAENAQTATPDPTLEVSFDEPITDPADGIDADNIDVYVDGTQLTVSDADVTALGGAPTRTLQVALPRDINPTEDLVVNVSGVEDTDGNVIDASNTTVTVTGATLDATGANYGDPVEDSVFRGTVIAVEFPSTDDAYTVYNGSGDFRFQGTTGEASRIAIFDTEGRTSDVFRFDDSDAGGADIELWNFNIETSISDTTVQTDESFTVDVETNAGGRETLLTVTSSTTDTSIKTVKTLDGDGTATYTIDASSLEPGNYTVNVTDVNTGVTQTAGTVTIQEDIDGDVNFAKTMHREDVGDIAEFTIEFTDRTTATFGIGSDDVNFISNITVHDEDGDGEVTLKLDTTAVAGAAAPSEYFSIKADGDDDATDSLSGGTQTEGVSSPLDSAGYELRLSADGVLTDVGSLYLASPELQSVETYVAPGSVTFDNVADVKAALADTDTIAQGDYLVTRVNVTGLEGTPMQPPAGVTLKTVEVNPGPNLEPTVYNRTTRGAQVFPDAENDTVYYVFDTEYMRIPFSSSSDNDIASVTLNSTFSVNATQSRVYTEDVNASDTVVLSEPSITVNGLNASETLVVEPGMVTVAGETNIAPSSQLHITITSKDSATRPYLLSTTTTVSEAGTFNASFDLSGYGGTAFTVTVKSSGAVSKTTTVDGYVKAGAPATTTTTQQQQTTTDQTTTQQQQTTTQQQQTTTDQTTTTTTQQQQTTTTTQSSPHDTNIHTRVRCGCRVTRTRWRSTRRSTTASLTPRRTTLREPPRGQAPWHSLVQPVNTIC